MISLQEAQRQYPSIALDGSGHMVTPSQAAISAENVGSGGGKGSGTSGGKTRYHLVEDQPTGLRAYRHYEAPAGSGRCGISTTL